MAISILMGSKSDLEIMKKAGDALNAFGIKYEMNVLSAHRTPEEVSEHVRSAPSRGIKIFICGAGMAAHLAGAVAGQTTLPVIGVPLTGSPLGGQDALLSTVQMPRGIPVATVAIDGAYNAGMLAVQMLALSDETLAQKLEESRQKMRQDILKINENLD
ncbi:MAG: 5-(carboxyamino)imidazole ribonucleotide mutase [bacterium]